ncbi:MAG: hypothetical protein V4440_07740 [Pseudomonadota bacterium]
MPEDLKSLVKNPLGIIALFIALIYGFAALLLGVSASQLLPEERQPLIWFIVLFPMVVLGTFYVLVTRHHGKLYAPKDYQNDDSFLKTLSDKQQEEKLDEEIQSAELISVSDQENPEKEADEEVLFSRSNDLDKYTSLKLPEASLGTLRFKYRKAEKLAISKIELIDGLVFRQQVSFGDDRTTAFDGVAINGNTVTAIEVKYIRRAVISRSSIREVLYRAILATKHIGSDKAFKLIIAIVLENSTEPTSGLEKNIQKMVADTNISVDVRVFRYDELDSEF